MHDQADYLRRLVRQDVRTRPVAPRQTPRMVAVLGGKGGVGATSLAVNLAVALARSGQRLALVDADLSGANVQALCDLRDGGALPDVLRGRRNVHECLQSGPGGIQVLPGRWAPSETAECSLESQDRLLGQLGGLGRHLETIVLDLGSGWSPVARRFVEAADSLLLVTSADPVSVMDSYAALKLITAPSAGRTVRPRWTAATVNMTHSPAQAREVHQRLAACCRRFLGLRLESGGCVPLDESVPTAGREKTPFVLSAADSPAAQAVQRTADLMLDVWENHKDTDADGVASDPDIPRIRKDRLNLSRSSNR
ncbi:MAG: P-loop NTPase [Planctomycetales bacterium]